MEKGPKTFKKFLKVRSLKKVIPKDRYNKALFHVFLISIASSVENWKFFGKKNTISISKPSTLNVHNVNSRLEVLF